MSPTGLGRFGRLAQKATLAGRNRLRRAWKRCVQPCGCPQATPSARRRTYSL